MKVFLETFDSNNDCSFLTDVINVPSLSILISFLKVNHHLFLHYTIANSIRNSLRFLSE